MCAIQQNADQINNAVSAGAEIIAAALDDTALENLKNKGFGSAIALNGQKLVFVVNTDDVTHVVIPSRTLVREMLDRIEKGLRDIYPPEYDSGKPEFIDPETRIEEAYQFRVGDYTFAQCG